MSQLSTQELGQVMSEDNGLLSKRYVALKISAPPASFTS